MIRVRIITIGDIYSELNTARLKEWKSDLFEFCDIIKHDLQHQTDLAWGYSDSLLEKILPKPADFLTNADLSFFVFDVPLEDNYFSFHPETCIFLCLAVYDRSYRIVNGKRNIDCT